MIKNSLFAIGIPTLNRADLLNPSLERYVDDFPATRIYIVDNGGQKLYRHPRITVFRPDRNLGVAGSWNVLCRAIFYADFGSLGTTFSSAECAGEACPYAFLLNDDVYSGLHGERLAIALDTTAEYSSLRFMAGVNWSSFVIGRQCYETVGAFDEQFYPAYYEDNDYRYRMKRAGVPYLVCKDLLHPQVFRSSCTLEKDRSIARQAITNRDRYRTKWGGLPDEETYREPYDGKDRTAKKQG